MDRHRSEAFYVDGAGPDPELFRQGLAWLEETSKAKGATTAYLVIPKLSQLTGTVSDVIGELAADALSKGHAVRLPGGTQLLAYSDRTLGRNFIRGPVLMVYCLPETMTKVDLAAGDQPKALIPWLVEEGRQWIAKHQARKIGAETDDVAGPPRLSNPVVERAFQRLTESVNLSTGIAHKLDRDKAVHLFRILKRNREEIDFDELPGWFIANGWRSNHADELTQMARDIYAGKRIQAGTNPWGGQTIRVWRREAQDQ
jgi:hypothetical protein